MSQSPESENELEDLKEAMSFVESLLQEIFKVPGLNNREKIAFTAAWKNESYQNVIIQNNSNAIKQNNKDIIGQNIIVENNNYAEGSIKNSGSLLYGKLEKLFQVKVTKKTLKGIVQSAWKSRQAQPEEKLLSPLPPPNWQNPQLLHSLTEHQDGVGSVTISPDGKTLASGSWDNTIKLWDLKSGELQRTLTGHLQDVASVIFLDEKTLLSASYDRTIKRWHLDTGELLSSLYNYSAPMESLTINGHSQRIECFALSRDGQVLASGSYDQTIKLWNIRTGEEIDICRHGEQVISIAFNSDRWILASGSINGGIKLWDLKQLKPKHTLQSNLEWVVSLAFSPDGKTLFSGSKNGKIEKWDSDSGRLIDTLNGHSGAVFSLAFSPDGQTLASGSSDNTIKLWNFHNGTVLQTLQGHSDVVMSVNFSPDGHTLISGSKDKTIKIWRATHERPKVL